jgi:predicted metalloprotease with PDZ domain
LCAGSSTGGRTARAVTILARVDAEIRNRTDGRSSLDDILDDLADMDDKITVARFREIVAKVAGDPVDALAGENLPGCETDD